MKKLAIIFLTIIALISVPAIAEKYQTDEKTQKLVNAIKKKDVPSIKKAIADGANLNPEANKHSIGNAMYGGGGADGTPLQEAIKTDDVKILKLLVDSGANIDPKGKGGALLLFTAVGVDNPDMVKFLLDNGVDINARAHEGQEGNILHMAAMAGKFKSIKTLVEHGADINAKMKGSAEYTNTTPLHLAVQIFGVHSYVAPKNLLATTKAVVESGGDVNAKGGHNGDLSPLMSAVRMGTPEVVNYLIEKGAKIDGSENSSPLFYAMEHGRTDMVKLLIEKGANFKGAEDDYPFLFFAIDEGNSELAKFLLTRGADKNQQYEGKTPLSAAITSRNERYEGSFEVVKVLLEGGADVKARDKNGQTPLHTALQVAPIMQENLKDYDKQKVEKEIKRSYEIAKLLIEKGVDVNAKDNDGKAPLFYAKSPEIINLLVKHKADVNAKDNDGKIALYYAMKDRKSDIINVLKPISEEVKFSDDDIKYEKNKKLLEALKGDIEGIKAVIAEGADINYNNGNPVLIAALKANYSMNRNSWDKNEYPEENILFLIENGADVNIKDSDGITPLLATNLYNAKDSSGTKIILALLKKGANPNVSQHKKLTVFDKGTDGKSLPRKIEFDEPLIVKLSGASEEVIRSLLEHGADVNVRGMRGLAPLHYYVKAHSPSSGLEEGNLEMVKLLLKHGADVGIKDEKGLTPLHMSAKSEIADTLINSGANINAIDNEGNTPLSTAASNRKYDVVRTLLSRGADKKIRNAYGKSPADIAIEIKQKCTLASDQNPQFGCHEKALQPLVRIIEILQSDNFAEIIEKDKKEEEFTKAEKNKSTNGNELFDAVKAGNLNKVQELVKNGADLNLKDQYGSTLLHRAANWQKNAILKYLLENGANPNIKSGEHNLPAFQGAALMNNIEAVKLLIEHGADVKQIDTDGNTAIHYSANPDYLKLMIEHGADVNSKNNNNSTPLHWANTNINLEGIKVLLDNKADPNIRTIKEGRTPLINAAYYSTGHFREFKCSLGRVLEAESWVNTRDNNKLEAAKMLVNAGAEVNVADSDGRTPLHYAACAGNTELIKFLLENGAKKDVKDKDGFIPSYYAVQRNNIEAMKLLPPSKEDKSNAAKDRLNEELSRASEDEIIAILDNAKKEGVDINENISEEIRYAINDRNLEKTKILINYVNDINSSELVGGTLLHNAAISDNDKNLEIIKFLLEKGADPNKMNKSGATPLHSATSAGGNYETVKIMLAKGADPNIKDKNEMRPLDYSRNLMDKKAVEILEPVTKK